MAALHGFLLFVVFLIAVLLLIILVYVLSRAAAMGWYRSKLEHMRELLSQISNGGDHNGQF